jgi:hypothetical protein
MWKIAAIALAGVAGAVALTVVNADLGAGHVQAAPAVQAEARPISAEPITTEAAAEAPMRVCLGPARVTLGGHPFARLAFGGEGCETHVAHLVGFGAAKKRTAQAIAVALPPSPAKLLPVSAPDLLHGW